jgi:hypothetical protein
MHQQHHPGNNLFVDWAGAKIPIRKRDQQRVSPIPMVHRNTAVNMPAKRKRSDSEPPNPHRHWLNCKLQMRIVLMDKISPILGAPGKILQRQEYQLRPINHVAIPHPLYQECIIYASSKTEIR